jgi:hypothetical protein
MTREERIAVARLSMRLAGVHPTWIERMDEFAAQNRKHPDFDEAETWERWVKHVEEKTTAGKAWLLPRFS